MIKGIIYIILLNILFSCNVSKEYYIKGAVKSKTYKSSKYEKTKYYSPGGKLISIKKTNKRNFERLNIFGKTLSEQVIKKWEKGYYNFGLRKKRYLYSQYISLEGFVYFSHFIEYNKKRKIILEIKHENIKTENKLKVKFEKEWKTASYKDTLLQYINKITNPEIHY